MQLSLAPEAEKIINDCVESGEFTNAEEVVTVALQRLVGADAKPDFAPGELDRLIEEGLNSGPGLSYEEFRAEFDAMRAKHLAGKTQ